LRGEGQWAIVQLVGGTGGSVELLLWVENPKVCSFGQGGQ